MNKNILIIHYNTPYLTECLVRSINLFVEDAKIHIFDNSDKNPFVAEFDNVTIFDNTKGQIIDFDKWLEKFPNRMKSSGKLNKWASAKHCYSVEKCMELMDDNFILLDSDVLLKRDISNLFVDDAICCAEVITQPRFNVKRVLPYICFINNKLCKEKGVHFFNSDQMYGLYKTPNGEKYDTGASFFLHAEKYGIKEIKDDDYIEHYKAGSWTSDAKKFHRYKQIDAKEWLMKNKKYWSTEKNKKVVYTCITGGYDSLKEPTHVCYDFDYVCFTDNLGMKSNVWEIRPLPKETEELSQVKKQRYVKINPHKVLSEYDISIWVDGNITVKGDVNDFVNKSLKDDCYVYVPKHPLRNCIYEEAKAVVSLRKDKKEIVDPQVEEYRKEGFPSNYGLLQSNVLLRVHNNEDCIKLMDAWFIELKDKSHRDQLSFNYAAWKNPDVKIVYLDKRTDSCAYFQKANGHMPKFKLTPRLKSEVKPKHRTSSRIIVKDSHKLRIL